MRRLLKMMIVVFIASVGVGLIFSYVMKNKTGEDISAQNFSGNLVDVGVLGNISVETSSSETVINPDTILVFETVYQDCKHIETTAEYASEKYINLTQEKFEEEYPDWIITEFSEEEVSIYRQEPGLCNSHYKITVSDNNNIIIYHLTSEYDTEIYEETDISAEYLAEEDIKELEERNLCASEYQKLNQQLKVLNKKCYHSQYLVNRYLIL